MDAMRKSIKVARAILGRRPLLSNNFQLKIYPGGIRRLAQAVHQNARTVRVHIFPVHCSLMVLMQAGPPTQQAAATFSFFFHLKIPEVKY